MRILIVNHYAGSSYHGMVFRHYYLAREWVKMGHEVTIVAASFTHIRRVNPEMEGQKVKIETVDGIRYVWLSTPSYKGNGVGRILNMLMFIKNLWLHWKQIADLVKPEVVISSSTYNLDIYTCHKIAKYCGAKLVYEVRDLWPLSPKVLKNMSPYNPYIWVIQRAEDYACRTSDMVVSVISKADRHLTMRGMSEQKYHIIANGVLPEEFDSADEIPPEHFRIISSLKAKGKFLIGYLGGIKISYGLELIIDVADKLRKYDDLQFVIVGDGPEKSHLEHLAEERQLQNVVFLPAIPKKTVKNFLLKMDALVATLPKTPLLKYGYGMSQNKVFDYMLSGKPIVRANIVDDDVVLKSSCGYVCDPSDVGNMAGKFLELMKMSEAERSEMGMRGRKSVLANFTYPILADQYIHVLNATA